mmetsp:Transcript_5498/g.16392  ORF Transcript_5498/g.16392 Transcript_5498/m.16392 type:complete len:149 (-) Transcript_5498:391-837(-)
MMRASAAGLCVLLAVLGAGSCQAGLLNQQASPSPTVSSSVDGVTVTTSGGRKVKLRESLQMAVILSYLKVLMNSWGPTENWLRRLIGGSPQRLRVWSEYCIARDKLILTCKDSPGSESFKAAVLASLLDDVRSEFRAKYPAWEYLFVR